MPPVLGMLKWQQVRSFPVRFCRSHTHASLREAVNESNNTPGGDSNEDSLSNGVAEEKLMPPNLDTFIPVDRLPDIIDVHVDVDVDPDFSGLSQYLNPWRQFTARHAIKFVRQYPPRTLTDEGKFSIPSRSWPIQSATDYGFIW